MDGIFDTLAAAYVRGSVPDLPEGLDTAEILRRGEACGLRLNRFKDTSGLPRVRAVLGAIRGIGPESLLDIGSGRGVFLWPLLVAFPDLGVTAVEPDDRRRGHLEKVRDGGVGRLSVLDSDASRLQFPDASFDVVTILEVLEHQTHPLPAAREVVRVATSFRMISDRQNIHNDGKRRRIALSRPLKKSFCLKPRRGAFMALVLEAFLGVSAGSGRVGLVGFNHQARRRRAAGYRRGGVALGPGSKGSVVGGRIGSIHARSDRASEGSRARPVASVSRLG
jgi:hypothetical protein